MHKAFLDQHCCNKSSKILLDGGKLDIYASHACLLDDIGRNMEVYKEEVGDVDPIERLKNR